MSRICLTGKGRENGREVHRGEWISRIEAAGHSYSENAATCDILVASRHDTSKAVNARARGARIITYEQLSTLLSTGSATTVTPPAAPVKPLDVEAMQDNPLWSAF